MFLLIDYVHLIKNILNKWLREIYGKLSFNADGEKKTVAWVYIKAFFSLEANQLLKIPKFPEVSLYLHVYQKVKSFHLLTKFWCWNIITIKCTSWFRKQRWNCEIHCQIYGILKKYKCSYPHLQIFVRDIWTELSLKLYSKFMNIWKNLLTWAILLKK